MNILWDFYFGYLLIGAGVILAVISLSISYLVFLIMFAWPHLLSKDE